MIFKKKTKREKKTFQTFLCSKKQESCAKVNQKMLTGFSDSRMNSEDYDAYDYLDWVLAGFYSVMLVFAFHGLAKTIFGNNASDPLFPKEQSKRRSGKRTFYFISTLLIIARCSFFIIRPLWIHQQIISNGKNILIDINFSHIN